MATAHVVKQGEHLSQIAKRYGFRDFRTVWEHPDNAALRKTRPSPNVLLPGDVVQIPTKQLGRVPRPTGASHRFQVSGQRLLLRLALRDFDDEPVVDTECELQIDGRKIPLKTDARGRIEVPITPETQEGTLVFKDPTVPFDVTVPIKVGHLDPVTARSGQEKRLSNLGYITRALEEVDATVFDHAVQEFQCDFDLPVTGVCDAATQAKLRERHGS
jgi:hypothetical protein